MAEGWKQVLQDIRNAVRGEAPQAVPVPSVREDGPSTAIPISEQQDVSLESPEKAVSVVADTDGETTREANVGATPALGEMLQTVTEPVTDEPSTEPVLPEPNDILSKAPPSTDTNSGVHPRAAWLTWVERALTALALVLVIYTVATRTDVAALINGWLQPKPPAANIVATYTGGQITTDDLQVHLKELAPTVLSDTLRSSQVLRSLVNEMVTDEITRRWAREQKVDADKNFQHSMEHITEQMNLATFGTQLHEGQITIPESEIQAYYEANKTEFISQTLQTARETIRRRLVEQNEGNYVNKYIERLKNNASIVRNDELLNVPSVTDAEVRDYFDANRATYSTTARFTVDILSAPIVTSEAVAQLTAARVLTALQTGANFATVPTQISGTRILTNYVAISGTQGAAWEAAVSRLKPNELSDVLRGPQTYEVVRLVKAEPSRPQTFEETKTKATATVKQNKLDTWMKVNGEKTLFNIKSRRYTLGQFYSEYKEMGSSIQAQFGGSDGLKRLLDVLIDRLVLVEDTYDQLLQEKNKAVLDQTRLNVLKQMMEQQEVDDKIALTDEELRKYYDANAERMALPPKVRIRYIRVGMGNTEDEQKAARTKADAAYQKLVPGLLQSSAEFADVAKEYSEDPETAARGGELSDWLSEGGILEDPQLHTLHELAQTLPINGVSAPTMVGDSLYIISPIERTESQKLTFEEAKMYLEESLREQKHRELTTQLQDKLLAQMNLIIYDSVLDAFAQQP